MATQSNDPRLLSDPEGLASEAGIKLVPIKQPDGTYINGSLPPITDIVVPKTSTKSALIRWFNAMGYSVKEIYPFLGVKYQMVRNIITTIPKRAAREDLPPLWIEYKPEAHVIDDALDSALDQSLLAGRKERNQERK